MNSVKTLYVSNQFLKYFFLTLAVQCQNITLKIKHFLQLYSQVKMLLDLKMWLGPENLIITFNLMIPNAFDLIYQTLQFMSCVSCLPCDEVTNSRLQLTDVTQHCRSFVPPIASVEKDQNFRQVSVRSQSILFQHIIVLKVCIDFS